MNKLPGANRQRTIAICNPSFYDLAHRRLKDVISQFLSTAKTPSLIELRKEAAMDILKLAEVPDGL